MVIIINYLQSADSLCFPSLNILQKLHGWNGGVQKMW